MQPPIPLPPNLPPPSSDDNEGQALYKRAKEGDRAALVKYVQREVEKIEGQKVDDSGVKARSEGGKYTPTAKQDPGKTGVNPFKGKSFEEIDKMLTEKGFKKIGPDPLNGKGSYFHPETGRKYYFDKGGRVYKGNVTEGPHIDVHNMEDGQSLNDVKHKFPLGDNLYE